MDPIELRLKNEPAQDEFKKLPFSSRSTRECYRVAAESFGWARRTPEPRSMRDGRLLIGQGMAAATYPTIRAPARAKARLMPDGTAHVTSAASDMGPGTWTSMTQVAADALGLPLDRVRFELGDTALPRAPVHGGSMTMASVGSAVQAACQEARAKPWPAPAAQHRPRRGAGPHRRADRGGGVVAARRRDQALLHARVRGGVRGGGGRPRARRDARAPHRRRLRGGAHRQPQDRPEPVHRGHGRRHRHGVAGAHGRGRAQRPGHERQHRRVHRARERRRAAGSR